MSSVPIYTKVEVAKLQLDRALSMWIDANEENLICSITLAGAAEEILGKLLEAQGKQHSLGSHIETCLALGRRLHGEEWSPKTFSDLSNYYRNGLKHIGDGLDISVPREAATEILDRAVDNYVALTGTVSPLMQRYTEIRHGASEDV